MTQSQLEQLELLERQISAGQDALGHLAVWQPVPAEVIALLTTAVPLRAEQLPAGLEPRLTILMNTTADLINALEERRRLLAGRVAAVRSARRAGPAPNLVDYTG